jgi:hypothetical protein
MVPQPVPLSNNEQVLVQRLHREALLNLTGLLHRHRAVYVSLVGGRCTRRTTFHEPTPATPPQA